MEHKKTFLQKLSGKGYYIAIGLCALAVGISGYLFCRDLAKEQQSLTLTPKVGLSALPAQTPTAQAPVIEMPDAPAVPAGKEEKPVLPDAAPETTAPETTEPAPAPTEAPKAAARQTVWPLQGEVIQTFAMDHLAYNETTRDWRTHAGLDLMAQAGTQVVCAMDGVVESVYHDDFFGQTVTVSHDDGWVTHYAGLDAETSVSAGDPVSAGQVLGLVGTTALLEAAEPPHLHFAVYHNNVAQDPEAFLGE